MIAFEKEKKKEKSVNRTVKGKEDVTRKKTGIGRGQSNLERSKKSKNERSESSSDKDDPECLFCSEKYSKDNKVKGG